MSLKIIFRVSYLINGLLPSEMSEGTEDSRKKLFGAQYTKRRMEMKAQRKNLSGSLKKFLKPSCSSPKPPTEEEQLVAEPMVIDDQQPTTYETHISPHLQSDLSTVSEDREITVPIADIDIADPSTWPNQLSHHLIQSSVANHGKLSC